MAIFYGMQYDTQYREMNRQERGITFSFEYAANIKYEKYKDFYFYFSDLICGD